MRIVQVERELQCLAEIEGPFAPKTVITNANTLAALASQNAAAAAAGALVVSAGAGKTTEAEVAAAAAAAFAADYGVDMNGDGARAAGGGGNGNGGGGGAGAGGKKKKKKSVAAPSAPSRLCPGGVDTILRFLHPDKPEDLYVPRRFADADGGSAALTAELVRLYATLAKACGEPDVAAELEDRLQCFPPPLQWLFLQHVQKNPFPGALSTTSFVLGSSFVDSLPNCSLFFVPSPQTRRCRIRW